MARRLPSLLLVLSLAGCAVGPDYQPPAPPPETALGPVSGTADIPAEWWALYHNAALKRLIEDALAHNPDLVAAQAALRVAHETAAANEGQFFPSLQGGFAASREKDATQSVQPTAADNSPFLTLFTPQLQISYAPDLWGGGRRGQESLDASSRAQLFQREATYLTLTSTVVVAAIEEASLRGQIAATERVIALERQSLDIFKRQVDAGQVSEQDALAQETVLAQAQQTLPPLQRQLDQQRHQLTALLGRLPADEPADRFELADLQLPADLPAALPSKLVAQRPDIRMADATLQVASAQIGVAIANRLPGITLDGTLGSSATRLGDLFSPGNGFWMVSGGVTAPLFDGFTLLHKERAARAAYDQAAAQYQSTVIAAFQNVADCLAALKTDETALRAAERADAASARSLAIAGRQLDHGAIAPLALLAAEQAALQAHVSLVQAQASQLADSAALFQALGGGWWNRPPAGAAD